MPGYFDPQTQKFIFVEDMVPEIVVPDLKDFQVKQKKMFFFSSKNFIEY